MENPKVSIIVPIYNVEKYLDRCMQSLLNQTLKDIEIIMVDDESPDNCPTMCDNYALQDRRIKVIHKKNGGLGLARNSGLEIATGKYVAFVDSDDYVDIKMYETLYNYAVEYEMSDTVFCGFRKETKLGYENHIEVEKPTCYKTIEDITGFILNMVASPPSHPKEREFEMSVWHSIYKFEIIMANDIKFISEREVVSEDFPFQVDFLKYSSNIAFIPNIFYTYCLNFGSLTQNFKPEKYNRYKKLYNVLHEKTKDIDKNKLRVNRFFIGYIRAHILTLMVSEISKPEKTKILEDICNDEIWTTLSNEYQPKNLPIIPRIIYICILRKWLNILYIITLIGGLKKQNEK